jgi:hypothetical protein
MLVGELRDGPLDIVGDVHGEIEPLRALLKRLGYGPNGHLEGRQLVFVGDLTDRGPDSPGVVSLVADLIAAGHAQCVLGNHELNILRNEKKHGNGWFRGKVDHHDNGHPTNERLADDRIRDEVTTFFRSLPLALERDDLRVVHACWNEAAIARLRAQSDVVALSVAEDERIKAAIGGDPKREQAERERATWEHKLEDPGSHPPMLRNLAEINVRRQNEHAVKLLTSGPERPTSKPFWVSGKWRIAERVPWWQGYEGPFVVVGHYWRSRHPDARTEEDASLFGGVAPDAPLGRGHVMCVDYSIGRCAEERAKGHPARGALAAYRWPERQLVWSPP